MALVRPIEWLHYWSRRNLYRPTSTLGFPGHKFMCSLASQSHQCCQQSCSLDTFLICRLNGYHVYMQVHDVFMLIVATSLQSTQ